MDRFERTAVLLNSNSIDKLTNSHVLVVGVGGVGGYAVEILARAGIGELTLVDGDLVDITNINRQIIALSSTVGRNKCDVFADRIKDINPNCKVNIFNLRYNTDTRDIIFSKHYDYVVDAIDSMRDKVELILQCHQLDIPIISAMGAGNRIEASDFIIMDIYKTSYDAMAKKLRKLLRENKIERHNVAVTNTPTKPSEGVIGSISYMPALAGVKIGSFVISQIIDNANE